MRPVNFLHSLLRQLNVTDPRVRTRNVVHMNYSDLFGHSPSPDLEIEKGDYLLAYHGPSKSGLAFFVSVYGDRTKTFPLPVSEVRFVETGRHVSIRVGAEKFPVIKARIPDWMAKQEGLI